MMMGRKESSFRRFCANGQRYSRAREAEIHMGQEQVS